jgi:excisionase family DNA binding protein
MAGQTTHTQEDYLTAAQAAAELQVSTRAIERWIEEGLIPGAEESIAARGSFPRDAFDAWLDTLEISSAK